MAKNLEFKPCLPKSGNCPNQWTFPNAQTTESSPGWAILERRFSVSRGCFWRGTGKKVPQSAGRGRAGPSRDGPALPLPADCGTFLPVPRQKHPRETENRRSRIAQPGLDSVVWAFGNVHWLGQFPDFGKQGLNSRFFAILNRKLKKINIRNPTCSGNFRLASMTSVKLQERTAS